MRSCYHLQTKLREGSVFTPVCQSVHRGVYPSMHLGHMTNNHHTSSCIGVDTQLVLGQQTGLHDGIGHMAHPPWADTPLGQTTPLADTPLADPQRADPPGQTGLLGRHPTWADTTPGQTPPGMINVRMVRILLECILV